VGGVVAAFKSITEMKETRLQRARDLRRLSWRMNELLDDFFGNERANDALLMLDWSGREHHLSSRLPCAVVA
jgi:hypothetical protein